MDESVKSIEDESILKLKRTMNNLYSIWDLIGMKEEKKAIRCKTAWQHVLELSQDIFNEDNTTYNSLLLRVKVFSEEISQLSKQLSVPCGEEVEGTLLVKEEILRKKVNDLKEMKDVRMKKFQELRNVELKYCRILDWSALEITSKTGVPSERDILELEEYVSVLQKERNLRFQRLCTAKRELTTILEITEIQPELPLEKKILSSSEDTITLTNETFEVLDEVLKKVRSRKADLENQRKMLLKKLNDLWERLQIPENERKLFLSKHQDYKVSTLKSIEDEIQNCEELKRQNLKKYICNLREELSSLWKDCFASDEEKENFHLFKSEEFTEENLKAHEIEVEKWRKFYEKIENIRKKIEKRNQLWDLLTVFENKANDPNRFKNRRGNLLKEEKDRKKLGEDLPALENEIFIDIENFEAENGISFLYHGENYRETVLKQWEERRMQKENEKIMRHKKRMLQVESEATLGTPSLKRTLCATPRNTPSKLFKSSSSVAMCRTPLLSATKNSPRITGKKSVTKLSSVKNCLLYGTQQRAVLKEKSQNNVVSGSKDDTTYSLFASTVDKSSRYLFRSSVLTSKKTVGTRISNGNKKKRISNSNKNKQRSTNKSLRRSTRNNVSAKFTTPARGNLGLPFLI
ncbi:protein regulator of cytokinesis 1-like [Uloborus diversus]|uniref:protein regulator of cytokinesis 1-like n=1 Tax=Uloborus diversus TaxID=327109 RepID=UPI002409E97B|nr:protein regulator of cytokinesis 1-like [Uloborus diversus]